MSNLTLNFDKQAEESIQKLKEHYNVKSKAEIIRKALVLLQFASEVEETKGELIARKGKDETKIIIR